MKTPIEIRNYLIAHGLEFVVVGKKGKYTIDVYKQLEFYKSGIVEYESYHKALIDTEKIFYNAIKSQQKRI